MTVALIDNMKGVFQTYAPLLRQMRDSLRRSLTPEPQPGLLRPAATALATATAVRNGYIAWAGLSALAGLALVLRRRRRNSQLDHGVLFLTCAGAWLGLNGVAAEVAGLSAPALLTDEVSGLVAMAAAATLGYIAMLAARTRFADQRGAVHYLDQLAERQVLSPDRLPDLIMLDLTLLAVWATTRLFAAASQASGSAPLLAGGVLTLALIWELGFSGSILNPGDAKSAMPHRARVITYLGYLLLVAAAVLQLGTIHSANAGRPAGAFDSETFVQEGILAFGVPLAITTFLILWISKGNLQESGRDNNSNPKSGSEPRPRRRQAVRLRSCDQRDFHPLVVGRRGHQG